MDTFFSWLRQQTERPDSVGTLARSAVKDKIFPRQARKLSILLLRYDREDALREAVKTAHAEWRSLRLGPRTEENA